MQYIYTARSDNKDSIQKSIGLQYNSLISDVMWFRNIVISHSICNILILLKMIPIIAENH